MNLRAYLREHPKLTAALSIGFVIITGLLAWNVYYQSTVFQIKEITPTPLEFPAGSKLITVTFNKDLGSQNSAENITLEPNLRFTYAIEGKQLKIQLDKALSTNDALKLNLLNVTSTNGKSLTQSIDFTIKYVTFTELSTEEQERHIKSSDSFENSYKLVDKMPIETLQYSIRNRFPDAGDIRMPIIISMNFNIRTNSETGTPTRADVDEYTAKVRKYRAEAITQVKALEGYDPKLYRFEFGENILLNEFDGTFTGATGQ